MALPEDWNGVDWRQTLISLPVVTNGIKTIVINRNRAPHAHKGYYMFATTYNQADPMCSNVLGATPGEPIVLYIASDVGEGGSLVSQFVFMHEIGHLRLGHIAGLAPTDTVNNPGTAIPTQYRNEIDADVYSLNHWIAQKTEHGLRVILAAINYLNRLNSAGDTTHPASNQRAQFLEQTLDSKTCAIVLLNDNAISETFARTALTDFAKRANGWTLNIETALTNANNLGRTAVTPAIKISDARQMMNYIEANPTLYKGLKFEVVPT
ncbi:hypothetical protein PHLH3_36020 [Pseudomonas sp. St386]|uniref:hypothetical protein n=1 Tax=Pseudomonas TaxID=286 RepID=UPI00069E77CE|nr:MULTISPECIES: hypothetical protein [Pseudomonas]AOS42595.1 hypothetical protein A0U95_28705 [Pseudomonas brassicacearum]ROM88069.1 hypothetical protein BK655_05465 [Pseudomonas brassicacearum]BBP53976.1 hypothetical protein PHLH3_36020 [Pseudomonas sp. St386]